MFFFAADFVIFVPITDFIFRFINLQLLLDFFHGLILNYLIGKLLVSDTLFFTVYLSIVYGFIDDLFVEDLLAELLILNLFGHVVYLFLLIVRHFFIFDFFGRHALRGAATHNYNLFCLTKKRGW